MFVRVLFYLKIVLANWVLHFLYKTNRWNISGKHHIAECLENNKSVIIASWHGYLLTTFMNHVSDGYYGLAGMHNDAELISRIGLRLGWRMLRGSSSDRGKEVFMEIIKTLKTPGNVVAITPDGPKGPAKIPKPGVVRAAQKTGAVIIPVIGQATRKWGFTNWDTFYVAKPFGRIEMIYGEPIELSADQDFESALAIVKTALDSLVEQVEEKVSG